MKLTAREPPRSYWRRVAEKNGILENTYRARIRRGWPPETAATAPKKTTAKPDPNSRRSKLRAAGLSEKAVFGYRQRNPDTTLSDDEIIALMLERKARKTLKQKAEEAGLHYQAVRYRLRSGWSEHAALTTPPIDMREHGRRHALRLKAQGKGIGRQG